jgi:predicted Holliday junction resolvase-like endonuclease
MSGQYPPYYYYIIMNKYIACLPYLYKYIELLTRSIISKPKTLQHNFKNNETERKTKERNTISDICTFL